MKKLIYVLIVGLLVPMGLLAQSPDQERGVVYSAQNFGGIILHSNGLGIHYSRGKYKGFENLRTFGIDLATLKHEKEIRAFNPSASGSTGSYFYGKLNSVFLIRPHIGRRKFKTQKLRANGVELGWNWEVGPTLALAKPVYLEIGVPRDEISQIIVEAYDPAKHDVDNILGRAGVFRGLSEMKPYIGAHAKFSVLFEYSNERDRVKGVEAGVALDVFAQKIPILAEGFGTFGVNRNRAIFPTFFVNFFIGKKYTQR